MPSSIPTLVPSLRSAALAEVKTQRVGSFWRRSWNRTRANPAQIIPQCASAEAGSEESERCEGSSSVTMDLCQKTSTEEGVRFCRAPSVSSNVSLVGWVSSWSASQPCSLGHASCLVVVSVSRLLAHGLWMVVFPDIPSETPMGFHLLCPFTHSVTITHKSFSSNK